MRISDWSSDVCSSDLPLRHLVIEIDARACIALAGGNPAALACHAALARTSHCLPPVSAQILAAVPAGRGGWADDESAKARRTLPVAPHAVKHSRSLSGARQGASPHNNQKITPR